MEWRRAHDASGRSPSGGATVMTRREEIENEAALWVARRADAETREAEADAFAAWIAASPDHKLAYWRLEQVWEEVDRLKALRKPGTRPARSSSPRLWWIVGLAALLITGVFVGAREMSGHRFEHRENVETASGERRLISLADGSAVELNTATKLRADVSREAREVWLEQGEAYFEVAHDPGRPFVVHAGARTITVLGTRFSVRRDGDRVTVAVRDGRVKVASEGAGAAPPPALLTRGEMIVADGPSIFVAPPSEEKVEKALSWRAGLITLDQATLAEAAAEFNRYNAKPIVVAPDAADLRISGAFEARNTAAFGRLLREGMGLQVDDGKDRMMISR